MNKGSNKRRRRLISFSLRTTLVAVTVFGVWFGLHFRSVKRQQTSVEAIRQLGGEVWYDYEVEVFDCVGPKPESAVPEWLLRTFGRDHFHDVVEVSPIMSYEAWSSGGRPEILLSRLDELPRLERLGVVQPVTDRHLRQISELTQLRTLWLADAREITTDGLRHLGKLSDLRVLHVFRSGLTNESLHDVAQLPQLVHLRVTSQRFTDGGLRHLADMMQLEQLHVLSGHATFSDAGLADLARLVRLESLTIHGVDITDASLRHLADLKRLRNLELVGSELNASWLSEQLPQCRIRVAKDVKHVGRIWPSAAAP